MADNVELLKAIEVLGKEAVAIASRLDNARSEEQQVLARISRMKADEEKLSRVLDEKNQSCNPLCSSWKKSKDSTHERFRPPCL